MLDSLTAGALAFPERPFRRCFVEECTPVVRNSIDLNQNDPRHNWLVSIIVIILFLASEVQAADSGTVGYEPSFFAPTNPVTALDIVDRVPGFQLQRQGGVNGQVRGFGGAASNVLINGSRPSTKSTPIEKILQRISAADVIRVDLIRGATGSLESSQASVVVNLMVKERDNESSTLWGASLSIEDGHITPNGNIAWSGNWNATSYTLSAEREKYKFDYGGPEILTNFFGPDEYRDETVFVSENLLSSNIETETRLENGDIPHFKYSSNSFATFAGKYLP